jgi:hypothetical protein
MDIIYKIASAWLYQNQTDIHWGLLYNGGIPFNIREKIHKMDTHDPNYEKELLSVIGEVKGANVELVIVKDFITFTPVGEGRVSYSYTPDGGVIKNIYTPYDILWNETKSGIDLYKWNKIGLWSSNCGYTTWSIDKSSELAVIRERK